MTLETALLAAIGTLVSVVATLAGVVVYLWKELRLQYRTRAKDSALFLSTLDGLRRKYSESLSPPDRHTPTATPRADPQTLEGFYSMHGAKPTKRTRG